MSWFAASVRIEGGRLIVDWPEGEETVPITRGALRLWPAGQPSWADGYLAAKPLDDSSEWLTVMPLTFGRARLCVADPGNSSIEHWCLDSPAEAIAAWLAWPDTPTRWNRHQRRDRVLEWPDGRTEPADPVVGNDDASPSREISEISEAPDA